MFSTSYYTEDRPRGATPFLKVGRKEREPAQGLDSREKIGEPPLDLAHCIPVPDFGKLHSGLVNLYLVIVDKAALLRKVEAFFETHPEKRSMRYAAKCLSVKDM